MAIDNISSHGRIPELGKIAQSEDNRSLEDFSNALTDVVDEVNEASTNADKAVSDAVQGKSDSLHGVMMAVNKADLSFRFVMQTRNKLVGAYNKIMQMQV